MVFETLNVAAQDVKATVTLSIAGTDPSGGAGIQVNNFCVPWRYPDNFL